MDYSRMHEAKLESIFGMDVSLSKSTTNRSVLLCSQNAFVTETVALSG